MLAWHDRFPSGPKPLSQGGKTAMLTAADLKRFRECLEDVPSPPDRESSLVELNLINDVLIAATDRHSRL